MIKELFRPLQNIEEELYTRIKNKVFSTFSSEHVTDKEKIISICQLMYQEYEIVLEENICQLNTHSLIEFMLEQYEKYARVNSSFHQFELSDEEEQLWQTYASHSRRGIKYLLELLCRDYNDLHNENEEKLTQQYKLEALSRIFISMEEMCSFYMRIDAYKYLVGSLELHLDKNKYTYFNVPQDSYPCN
ncbi:hypothetical protein H5202_22565, partial [Shewanella sp. SG41-4]|uniref:hypothetical protein n=1 Tax=Shewanella sp. SG41-4 TaxID=2760976 RepID=UPI001603B794